MLEVTSELVTNVPLAAVTAVSAGLLRNVAGWLENSLKDGKVDEFEIRQLAGTIIKYFASVSILMIGLPIDQAVVGTFILDVGASALKNNK
ncbi:MAG: hypothetical protein ABIG69_18995 [Bacteroidota bacterium]